MFAIRLITPVVTNLFIKNSHRKEKRVRRGEVDIVTEQVKKALQETDQKLILMVRS